MKNTCMKWKDRLLEAALAETAGGELSEHLSQCPDCAAELKSLRARREQLDTLLPLVARAEEPSADLRARIVAAAGACTAPWRPNFWRQWVLVGATTVIVIGIVIGWAWNRQAKVMEAELRSAQALAQWRAPTDVLLRIPGQEFLSSTPRLGESYIKIPVEMERGGRK
jgi:anti-sigma factor RsiW